MVAKKAHAIEEEEEEGEQKSLSISFLVGSKVLCPLEHLTFLLSLCSNLILTMFFESMPSNSEKTEETKTHIPTLYFLDHLHSGLSLFAAFSLLFH
jgi:hypothetical protein